MQTPQLPETRSSLIVITPTYLTNFLNHVQNTHTPTLHSLFLTHLPPNIRLQIPPSPPSSRKSLPPLRTRVAHLAARVQEARQSYAPTLHKALISQYSKLSDIPNVPPISPVPTPPAPDDSLAAARTRVARRIEKAQQRAHATRKRAARVREALKIVNDNARPETSGRVEKTLRERIVDTPDWSDTFDDLGKYLRGDVGARNGDGEGGFSTPLREGNEHGLGFITPRSKLRRRVAARLGGRGSRPSGLPR